MRSYRRRQALLLTAVLLCVGACSATKGQSKFVTTRGKEFISPGGKPLLLKGINLDMHAAPGGQTGDNIDDSWGYPFLFESAESQELTVNIWRKIAARYRDEPTVVGYELLNEPISNSFDTAYLNPKLEPLYRKIVTGIREVDKNHIIFLGGAQWDTNFKIFGPPFDDKLAYTFHKYWMDVNKGSTQEYLDFRDKYNVAVWMGESGENSDEWITSFRVLLEQNNISWCFWPYKKLDATSCIISINSPAEWEAIVAFANGRINQGYVKALGLK